MSIEVKIKKDFGEFTLDVDYKGESRHIGILGASGSGKSLTLKCIAGIETPQEGKIAIDGKTVYDSKAHINLTPQVRHIGYLFQNYALFPNMNVRENIRSGIRGNKKERLQKADEVIEKFGLEKFVKRLPSQLSGGQQQRVALARIIASEPDVILLDEPFSALDAYMREEMQKSLYEMLKDFKGIIITVSHSRDEIYTMSDELIIVDKGIVAASGKTADIFKNPPNVTAALLTGCKNIADAALSENGIFVNDWGMEFKLENPNGVKAVAIRAHDFTLEEKKGAFCFDMYDVQVRENLFEYSVFFKPTPNSKKTITFKISAYMWNPERDKIPEKLYLERENLLLLY